MKAENELRKQTYLEVEKELLQLGTRAGLSEHQDQQVMQARGEFIQAQKEYLERTRDHYEMYKQLEACICEPEIARSWMAHLHLATATWEAKERLAKKRTNVIEWVQALKNDRRNELNDLLNAVKGCFVLLLPENTAGPPRSRRDRQAKRNLF